MTICFAFPTQIPFHTREMSRSLRLSLLLGWKLLSLIPLGSRESAKRIQCISSRKSHRSLRTVNILFYSKRRNTEQHRYTRLLLFYRHLSVLCRGNFSLDLLNGILDALTLFTVVALSSGRAETQRKNKKKPAHSLQRQETNWGLCLQPGAGRTGLSECETTLT